ncbi:MAG: bifunctional serine/threonine-protein kinase/formylglycine-generating enzyme family protein [Acidobacteriota bacterium]
MSDRVPDGCEPTEPTEPGEWHDSREPAPIPSRIGDRLVDEGLIGRGGMAEVRRVLDLVLNRRLAMKILLPELAKSEELRRRFLAEAQATAQLQHPGIVPVVDLGELPDGRPWFTMAEVHGGTFARHLREHRAGHDSWPGPSREHVDHLRRVCQAVAHAHARGVVHRDLKPDNILLGELGEVLVLDWGVAKLSASEEPWVADAIETERPEVTRVGRAIGTPCYMAPEQARAEAEVIGPPTDVYALGAILHELLVGEPPLGRHPDVARRRLREGPPPALSNDTDRLPEELVACCRRAIAWRPEDRHATVLELAADLSAWLDGVRRREQALAIVAHADAMRPTIERDRRRAETRLAEANAKLDALDPHASPELKKEAWSCEDESLELERRVTVAEVERVRSLQAALELVPDLPEALDRLADHHRSALQRAEARGDVEETARQEALLRGHGGHRHLEWLDAGGRLTLLTEPPGARAELHACPVRDRRFVAESVGELGTTPLVDLAISRGSHAVRLTLSGHHDTWYPVFLEREGHWQGLRPGDDATLPVRLPKLGEIDDDEVHVPAGWFQSGGDPRATDGLPLRWLWVDAFVVKKHPVTNAEYLEFLNDLVAQGRREEAERALPREEPTTAGERPRPVFRRDADGLHVLPESIEGRPTGRDWPVTLVDWWSAQAHARWLAEKTGRPWRLLHDQEWEKAARGVDGRHFSWGSHFEPAWASALGGESGRPVAGPVGTNAVDVSPWGVTGLTGNVRDWCLNSYRRGPEATSLVTIDAVGGSEPRFVRGGSHLSTESFCRAATRFGIEPEARFTGVGFRLARSLPR